jgi:acylphosphatase
MPDGSVYMEAEGKKEALDALVEWSRQGPSAARVNDIQVNYSDYPRNFRGFEIRYW